ncbi:MAG: thioredoxin family protein [Deltaproteobacteria bacterium]|nr:thioredoxin family protein [Deltaproteobacteria bacterium]
MPDSTDYYILCTHCGAKNKLPVVRLGQSPNCGKCKEQLFSESSPLRSGTFIVSCKQCQTSNKIPFNKIGDQPICGRCKSSLAFNFSTQTTPLLLSDQNFTDTVLRSPLPFLVNFFSPNCGPCKLLSPTINKIARDYQGRLKVGSFNVDLNQHVPTLYRVGGTPTLVLFQYGKELGRLEGYQPSGALISWIQPHAW